MPVHLYGQPADLDPIQALGLPVVEDAAHAAESEYRGRKIGGLSEATCFSLYATKSIAAGEGGIVTTNQRRAGRGDPRADDHAPRPRLALRHRGARATRPTSPTCSPRSRSASSTRSSGTGRYGCGRSRSTTRPSPSWTGSSRWRATRVTCTRTTCIRCESSAEAGADARRLPRGARRGEHRHERPLPAGPPADRVPRALPGPAPAAGRRARRRRAPVAAPLARALGADIEDAIEALRRVHAAFTG